MKKLIVFLLCLPVLLPNLNGQTAVDALRYSQIFYNGTARFQGLGGAFGAVGADFSTVSINPAGIGLFKSSEFTLSPSFWLGHTNSSYNDVTSTDNRANFALGDFGLVFSIKSGKKDDSHAIKYINFGIGLNRQNDFNTRVYIAGQNNSSSILTNWTNLLNTQPGVVDGNYINNNYPFDIAPAYNSGLIYYDSVHKSYTNDGPNGGVYQQKWIRSSGSINEFELSLGTNVNDMFYIGITLGIPTIRYYESSDYQETKTDENIPYFRQMNYKQVLETQGTGINLKVGLIYRPASWVRIGIAIHTPTYYANMRDNWSSYVHALYDSSLTENTQYSPAGYNNYQMTTPFRAIGSLAFIISKYGLVSADYEYVNYNQARFYASSEDFSDVNQQIKNNYISPVNLRVGTEWKISDFRIRGGFGYSSSPYQSGINTGERYMASGGFGYRGKHLFADVSYVWTQMSENYYLYDPALVNAAMIKYYTHSATLTLGVRF